MRVPGRCATARRARTRMRRRLGRPATRARAGRAGRAGAPPCILRCQLASAATKDASIAAPSVPTSPAAMQRRTICSNGRRNASASLEAPMPVLARGRVVRHGRIGGRPAEPAMGQVEADLLAQATFGPDAVQPADQRHADQELGRDRGPAPAAVARSAPRSSSRSIRRRRCSAGTAAPGARQSAPSPRRRPPIITAAADLNGAQTGEAAIGSALQAAQGDPQQPHPSSGQRVERHWTLPCLGWVAGHRADHATRRCWFA